MYKTIVGLILIGLSCGNMSLTGETSVAGDKQEFTDVILDINECGTVKVEGIVDGFINLIAELAGGYAAQDFSMEKLQLEKKGGFTVIRGIFQAMPPFRLEERIQSSKDVDGQQLTTVQYCLESVEPGRATNENFYFHFPIDIRAFRGGQIVPDGGTPKPIPIEVGNDHDWNVPYAWAAASRELTLESQNARLSIISDGIEFSVKDLRPHKEQLLISGTVECKPGQKKFVFGYGIKAAVAPFYIRPKIHTWVEMPHVMNIVPGSILDFSFLNDPPASKYGRIVNKDGHFAYEQTGKRVRLVGVNLYNGANFLDKQSIDILAVYLQRMGYNTVRLLHADAHIRQENCKSAVINEQMLDRLDYTFAAMKKAGMYIATEFYIPREFASGRISGNDKNINENVMGLLPIYPSVFEVWKQHVAILMNHVNPYTGNAWKDDPALVFISPLCEDRIGSMLAWNGIYSSKFHQWEKNKGIASDRRHRHVLDPVFARFLIETKNASNSEIVNFLHSGLGLKTLLAVGKWSNQKTDVFIQSQFDVISSALYADCNHLISPLRKFNHEPLLRSLNSACIPPNMMAPNRVFGKPFVMTNYNFYSFNQFRAEFGGLIGAYSALQDWDGIYFPWLGNGTDADALTYTTSSQINHLNVSTDPLFLLSGRQAWLLFGRGDVAPGRKKFHYVVTMKDASRTVIVDSLETMHFPTWFYALGLVSQIGSRPAKDSAAPRQQVREVVYDRPVSPRELKAASFPHYSPSESSLRYFQSDTGEITLDMDYGWISIVTPRTELFTGMARINQEGNCLKVNGRDTFSSISASAMDGKNLAESSRVLIFHITNVCNTNMKFSGSDMKELLSWGTSPLLARVGKAEITLKNTNPQLKLWAVDLSGNRVGEVPTTYVDGIYSFTLAVTATQPTMVFELAAK